ncbi:hypothetical protein PHOSAC3_70038 [Mesotoga infera]|nr:hypothetical protein PHOSAC3_70038 [Mesotoga infera]
MQLRIIFSDGTFFNEKTKLYGGIWRFSEGEFNNKYYLAAQEKPSPLGDQFNEAYFFLDMLGC